MSPRITDVVSSKIFIGWVLGLFAAWGILVLACSRVSIFKDKPRGAAHQIVVIVPFTYLCVKGIWVWFFDAGFMAACADDRLYCDYAPSYEIVEMLAAFMLWDFVTTLVSKELRKFEHLFHHGMVGVLAMISATNGPHGFILYYVPFYMALMETSSVPLAFVDLFRMFKPLAEAAPALNEACRVTFAVLFLAFRCIYWPVVNVDFWRHALHGPLYLTVWWFIANILMTGLQYYWGMLICRGILKMIRGQKSDPDAETEARSPIHSRLLDSEVRAA